MAVIKLSIVLPCFNEAPAVPRIFEAFRGVRAAYPWELILVDNGSSDGTGAAIAVEIKKPGNEFARLVTVELNQGYGYGILHGLESCSGETLAWSHADLQTPPADIFRAYERLAALEKPLFSMVKGRRLGRRLPDSFMTAMMGLIATIVLFSSLRDINAQPKVFPRTLYARFKNPPQDFNLDLYLCYLARRSGFRVETIPVTFEKRPFGLSKWATSLGSRLRFIGRTVVYIFRLKAEGP
jgi:glycosyltransferase involved in cell wall biosynthesis